MVALLIRQGSIASQRKMETRLILTISIVTHNSKKDIRGVLDSLMASDYADICKVYVVDNGSTDGTVELVESEYPNVTLIHSENVGYGAGNNKVLLQAESDYHFVLNPDVVFTPHLLSEIVAYMEQNTACVLCTPDVVDADGRRIPSPKKSPRLRYIVARYLPWNAGLLRKWHDEYTDFSNHSTQAYPIELCAGFFMAMRTKAAQDIGGFDERFFLYYEDTDLSKRMMEKGKVMCLPYLYVCHNSKRAAYYSKQARGQMIRSLIRYFNKWGWRL